MRVRAATAAVLAIVLTFAALAASATGANHVRLPSCSEKPAYKPKGVIITCGDGAFRVVKLKWSTWTRKTAIGKGTAKVNTCDPNCATGKFKRYPVKLTAGRPKQCGPGDRQFTRLTYSFPGKKPAGPRTAHLSRPCNG